MSLPSGRIIAATLTAGRYNHHRRRPPPAKPRPAKPTNPEPSPPTYTRNTIHTITTLLRSSPWDSAQDELRRLPVNWDSHIINRVLKTHPPMEKAWLFFNWAALLPNFKHDHFTYTTMLDIFGEAGRLSSMRHVFEQMAEKGVRVDAAVYTSVMHWLAKGGDLEGAMRAWGEMRRRGCRPTVVSYTAFMKILFDNGMAGEAAGVYREMIEVGLSPNCHTYTVLMEHLAGDGKFEATLKIMSEMQEAGIQPDKAACNILVQKCSRAREVSTMSHILLYMKEHSIVLRRPVFLEALEALQCCGENDHLLREANPHLSLEGIEEEMLDFKLTANDTAVLIDRGIIINLLERHNWVAIEHVLCGLVDKEIQLDSDLISAVVQASCANYRLSGALMAFRYSTKTGKELDRSAYICLLGIFMRTNSFEMVLETVEVMVKVGIELGAYLVSILIYKLGAAGLSSSAKKIFSSLPTYHNTVTCTAMMDAYFHTGEVDKGLAVYSTMRNQGVTPTFGTYEVLRASPMGGFPYLYLVDIDTFRQLLLRLMLERNRQSPLVEKSSVLYHPYFLGSTRSSKVLS